MTDENFAYVDLETLERFMKDVMIGVGIPPEDAAIVAEVLIESDKRGIDSHGVERLSMYYERIKRGQINPVTQIDVIKDTPSIARLSANNGMGHPAGKFAMQLAIKKAKETGMGMVTVGQSNHFGIAGYYALLAAQEGCIGMCGTNARPSIAPTWSVQPKLGTNPFTIAMPTDWDFPWCADHATSIIQRGKVEIAARLDKPLTPGWVIDSNGEPATDARALLTELTKGTAALTPLGGIGEDMAGYKGYNYATFVEIMSTCLSGANFLSAANGIVDGQSVPYNLGHFFMVVDISAFIDLEEFKHTLGNLLRELADAKLMPGAEHIYIAGEKEYNAYEKRKVDGVPIPEVTQIEMLNMAKDLGLEYEFNFNVDPDKKLNLGW